MRRLIIFISLIIPAIAGAQSLFPNRISNDPVPVAPRQSSVPDDEEDVYLILSGEADKAIAEGDFATARDRLVEALSIDRDNPQNVLLLSNLGMVYSYLDCDSLAIDALTQALNRAPMMTTVRSNRAMVYLQMGDDRHAFHDFSSTIALDSLNVDARYYHGIMSLYIGDIATAEADFDVLQSQAPESYYTNAAKASLYSFTDRYREAIPYYKKLIEDDPSPEYYAALANCLVETGELTEASEVIAGAMEKYTKDADLYLCRARLNKARYRLDDARDDARTARQLGASAEAVENIFGHKNN